MTYDLVLKSYLFHKDIIKPRATSIISPSPRPLTKLIENCLFVLPTLQKHYLYIVNPGALMIKI